MTHFSVDSLSLWVIFTAIGILFAAGMTKGILGIGLPIIAVPLLSALVPLPTAVALLTIPLVMTNFTQAISGEPFLQVLRRLLPILVGMVLGVIVGVKLLTGLNPAVLKPLVGTALIGVAVLMLLSPRFSCPERLEPVISPLAGIAGGILGGLAGQSGTLVFIYLLSLGITGDRFVQYSSMYLVIASVVLTAALGHAGAIGWTGAELSALCALPILVGMRFGAGIRGRLPARLFRKLVLGVVILSGVDLCEPSLVALIDTHSAPIETAAKAAHVSRYAAQIVDRK